MRITDLVLSSRAEDRLYVAFGGGNLSIYFFTPPPISSSDVKGKGKAPETESPPPVVKLITTRKNLSKKPIESLGWLEETRELVVLSDGVITLWDLPNLKTPTVITQAKYVQSMAIQTHLRTNPEHKDQEGTSVTTLVIGCRKKVVVMAWANGKPEPTRDLIIPHTPRLVLFSSLENVDHVHLLCSATDYYILRIPQVQNEPLSYTEPPPIHPPTTSHAGAEPTRGPIASSTGVMSGAFTGLGGYVGKGLGALAGQRTNNLVGSTIDSEQIVLVKEGHGVFIGPDGLAARKSTIEWQSPPEDIIFVEPYIVSVIPVVSDASNAGDPASVSPGLEFRLSSTQAVMQRFPLSTNPSSNSPAAAFKPAISTLSLLTKTPTPRRIPDVTDCPISQSFPAFFASTPTDKVQLQIDGNTIWCLAQESASDQLYDLMMEGRFSEASSLLEGLTTVDNRDERKFTLRRLQALANFASQKWDEALDEFIALDINPAQVVALYPESTLSGSLHEPYDNWITLFGGPEGGRMLPTAEAEKTKEKEHGSVLKSLAHLGLGNKTGSSNASDLKSDTSSIRSERATLSSDDEPVESPFITDIYPRAALESLARYLSDRRQKIAGAMANLKSPLPATDSIPPLRDLDKSELFAIPSVPINTFDPEQLLLVSKVVYTALLKVYLVIRPVLVGSLCRIENWCDVTEVEELLREKGRFDDLVDLYQGKKMHAKALNLLRELAANEEDKLDKLPPTIRYLQKLGPSHLQLIFDQSEWLLKEDPKMALQVFTADEAEVEALPRKDVSVYLERHSLDSCVGYLEHIINDLDESGPDFHDKLAELYLIDAKKSKPKDAAGSSITPQYEKLLSFLKNSDQYRSERLLGKLKQDDLPRARAILLGKLGNHEAALQIYVHRLTSYPEADEYCSKVYAKEPDAKGIFLLLLKIYLKPTSGGDPLLDQALNLIATHGTRIDAMEAISLLPPLVTMKDVHDFFLKTMRQEQGKMNESKVIRGLLKTRKEQVDMTLMGLQQKRVRITDIRM